MSSFLERLKVPHVFTLLTVVIFICSLLTYIIPSGHYERESKNVGGHDRTVVVAGTYSHVDKAYSFKGATIGEEFGDKASPVSLIGFLRAIPKGMEDSGDIIFFIFMIGGVFGILQRTGVISASIQLLLSVFRNNSALLTIILMMVLAAGGSTLGMGEEFIPLVPIFLIVAKEMGFDRIYGLALVWTSSNVGFAAATTNPFTVSIANNISELPLNTGMTIRIIFFGVCMAVTIIYVLRYGAKIKADPGKSIMAGVADEQEALEFHPVAFTNR
ncbi:MAG TPA: hypothetical protein PKV71_19745, partial [Calditrichia bacterium]|nr:hypothetical protein [Calditrichia bacterium]